MSQALPVLSSAPRPPVAGAAAPAAESADSGHNFEAALASQRDAGEAPANPEPGHSGAPTASGAGGARPANAAPGAAAVAAGGKELPPELPVDPAAMVVGLLRPGGPAPAIDADVPAAVPEGGDILPETADAVAAAPVPILLLTPAASAPPVAPIPTEAPDPVATAVASAARTAQSLHVPGSQPAATPASTEPLGAMASHLDGGASADDAAARLAMLKAATDAGATPSPVEGRAPSTPTAGFQTLVNLSGPVANAPAAAPASAQVNVPVGHPGWGQAFGNQVVWAVNQAMPAASLHLSPPELGPLSVQIRIDQDQASIQFVSAHAAVRDAIEAALPRLREMLGGQGIVLADVNVSQHGQSGHAQRDASTAAGAERGAGSELPDELAAPSTTRTIGMLDVYA